MPKYQKCSQFIVFDTHLSSIIVGWINLFIYLWVANLLTKHSVSYLNLYLWLIYD